MTTVKEPLNGHDSSSFLKSVISNLKPRHDSDPPVNKPSDKLNPNHCQFSFADGRQCKMPPAHLCAHHTRKRRRPGDEVAPDLALQAPGLVALCSDLTTATNINRALAQVFLLMAHGRISQKQAVAFGYLSQLLLQTVPGIRSEFVSAFGYHPWEQRLKTSLESNHNEEPDDPAGGEETPKQPIDKPVVDPRPFEERVMEPDYDSIVSRGRDLLAGKYSVTPEGRRETETLNTELELMKPPAAKMPKGARASVIEHMKHWIAQKKKPAPNSSDPANMPRALNLLGHPIPWAVQYDKIDRCAQPASRTPSRDTDSASQTPSRETSPAPPPLEPEIPNLKLPVPPPTPSQRAPEAPEITPPEAHFVAPPPRRQRQPDPPPTRLDWYAPVSWSNTRKPDPFPGRREQLARQVRGMSNCRARHLQHSQQSQASPLK